MPVLSYAPDAPHAVAAYPQFLALDQQLQATSMADAQLTGRLNRALMSLRLSLVTRQRIGEILAAIGSAEETVVMSSIVVRLASARAASVPVLPSIAALASLATVAPAGAASIAFIKGGNVWLAAPDGSVQRQLTGGGGFDSPSQADDGTLPAQNGTQLFRLNRYGQQLVPAINTDFTGAPSTAGAGPVNNSRRASRRPRACLDHDHVRARRRHPAHDPRHRDHHRTAQEASVIEMTETFTILGYGRVTERRLRLESQSGPSTRRPAPG